MELHVLSIAVPFSVGALRVKSSAHPEVMERVAVESGRARQDRLRTAYDRRIDHLPIEYEHTFSRTGGVHDALCPEQFLQAGFQRLMDNRHLARMDT